MSPSLKFCARRREKYSLAMTDKKDERGSPYLNLDKLWKNPYGISLQKIKKQGDLIISLIVFNHLSTIYQGISFLSSCILQNVYLYSQKLSIDQFWCNTFVIFLLKPLITSCASRIPSLVDLFWMNAHWFFQIRSSLSSFILLHMTLAVILISCCNTI